jgi:hypothetical protein
MAEPVAPGTTEHFTVNRLTNGATYYFAVRSIDVAGNASGLSNAVSANLPVLPFYALQIRSAPTYVANDHTPSLFQIGTPATGSGLAPNAVYYYKVLFSDAPQHETASDRGWTARGNETPDAVWVHADEPWNRFPTLTTDSDGAIIEAGSNGLGVYGRFGDTRRSGGRYVQIVLARKSADSSAAIPGSEVYPRTPVSVTVFDPTTHGAWVHNGVSNILGTARVSLAPSQGAAECYALAEGYPRWLYSTGDGPYWGTDLDGSFRMAVPVTSGSFGVYTGNSNARAWNEQEDLVVTLPGASYAAGASDMVPPSAATTIAASSENEVRDIRVTWSGAADDRGVAGYYVYRWQAAPAGARFTPEKRRLATVRDGDEYLDTGVVLGQTYHYEVRAFDEATNVSPAIGCMATSRDARAPTSILNLAVTKTAARSVRLTWTAPSRATSEAVAGYQLRRSTTPILTLADFETATPLPVGIPASPGTAESVEATGLPTGVNYFSIRSVDALGNRSALSNTVAIIISRDTTITIKTASTSTSIGRTVRLSGLVTPPQMIGVNIVVYVMKPGKSYWTYSSNRTVYTLSGSPASWLYPYYFKRGMAKGYYRFKARCPAPGFASSAGFTTSESKTISIRVR